MKFLKAGEKSGYHIAPGVYRTRLLRCKYSRFKSDNDVCGINFTVAWPNVNRELGFVVFVKDLPPILRRLTGDLRMKRVELYEDGEEEQFMADLNAKCPVSVQVSVTDVMYKDRMQQRWSLSVLKKGEGVEEVGDGDEDIH